MGSRKTRTANPVRTFRLWPEYGGKPSGHSTYVPEHLFSSRMLWAPGAQEWYSQGLWKWRENADNFA